MRALAAAAALLFAASGFGQTLSFTTIAGTAGNSSYGNGANGMAAFSGPMGVAVDGNGNVFVADSLNNVIRKITNQPGTTNWFTTTIAGSLTGANLVDGENGNAQFNQPEGVAVDAAGNVYVADTQNYAVRKITNQPGTTNWFTTTLAGGNTSGNLANGANGAAQFSLPSGLAATAAGVIFVADTDNNAIRMITNQPGTTNWITSTIAGGNANSGSVDGTNLNAQFNDPAGVAVDANGNLYVADQFNNTIRKITRMGANWITSTIAGQALVSGAADGTNTAALFNSPTGVAVDTNGNVFVADQFNNAIRKIAPSETNWATVTIGGQAAQPGAADGAGTNALFSLPFGIAADAKGNLFVADTGNDTLREDSPYSPATFAFTSASGPANGQFGLALTGPAGELVVVEASTDLVHWTPVLTNTFGAAALLVNDAQAGAHPRRFYRAFLASMISNAGMGFVPGGGFGFNFTWPAGQTVVVQASSDLVNWVPIYTNSSGAGQAYFSGPAAGGFSRRFYRTKLQPAP